MARAAGQGKILLSEVDAVALGEAGDVGAGR